MSITILNICSCKRRRVGLINNQAYSIVLTVLIIFVTYEKRLSKFHVCHVVVQLPIITAHVQLETYFHSHYFPKDTRELVIYDLCYFPQNIVSSGCHGNEVDELLQEALDSKGAFVATYPLGSRMQEVDWQREYV